VPGQIIFFGGTGVWTQDSMLAKVGALLLEPMPLVHFEMVILEVEVSRTICSGWP
jgi:hypothetical protein